MRYASLFLFFIILTACSTRRDLPERLLGLLEKQARNLPAVPEGVGSEAKLPDPFSLAVYFRSPQKGKWWKWASADKQMIFSAVEGQLGKRANRVFELINTGGLPEKPESLRRMALQQGADALLLVQGAAEVETYLNPWALTYIALAPMLFVEGGEVTGAFLSQAVLWNTRKSHVHLGVQSEGDWSMERPAVFKQQDRAVRKSKEAELESMASKLKKNFQEVLL